MPKLSESWSELKAFDSVPPGELAFRAIVALLETWQGNDQAKAIARDTNTVTEAIAIEVCGSASSTSRNALSSGLSRSMQSLI